MLGVAQSALEPIATAVFAALNNSTGFTGLSPILNYVPQGTAFPYTVLQNFTEAPWNTMAEYGKHCTFQLHTVSQGFGDQEGFRIQSAARSVLDYQKLSLANHRMVQCKFETGDHWTEDPINGVVTRHHVNIYKVDVTQST